MLITFLSMIIFFQFVVIVAVRWYAKVQKVAKVNMEKDYEYVRNKNIALLREKLESNAKLQAVQKIIAQ